MDHVHTYLHHEASFGHAVHFLVANHSAVIEGRLVAMGCVT